MTIIQAKPSRTKPCVFIHTNHKQILGALVGAYSIRRQSRTNEKFDVCLIKHADHPFLHEKEGESFLRDGVERIWRNEDLQSFTPLRFMAPELMGYWSDPDFDPNQSAFYYVRVIEIPTPRWTAYDAKFFNVKMPEGTKMQLQDRAYTSPIWYTPSS